MERTSLLVHLARHYIEVVVRHVIADNLGWHDLHALARTCTHLYRIHPTASAQLFEVLWSRYETTAGRMLHDAEKAGADPSSKEVVVAWLRRKYVDKTTLFPLIHRLSDRVWRAPRRDAYYESVLIDVPRPRGASRAYVCVSYDDVAGCLVPRVYRMVESLGGSNQQRLPLYCVRDDTFVRRCAILLRAIADLLGVPLFVGVPGNSLM